MLYNPELRYITKLDSLIKAYILRTLCPALVRVWKFLNTLHKSTSHKETLSSKSENLGAFCSVPYSASTKTLNPYLNTGGLSSYKKGICFQVLGLPGQLQGLTNWIPKCFSSVPFLLFWDKSVSSLFLFSKFLTTSFSAPTLFCT